jgi:3-deoxy-D-manno-octulosonic acid kinase
MFLGYSRSRPFAEAEMLTELSAQGLPVPNVLGAICLRKGMTYSGALLTERIADATTLADLLPGLVDRDPVWSMIGCCLRRFHAAGVYHADLNARNILVDARGSVWLLDFDRARWVAPNSRRLKKNLQRLLQSLRKLDCLSAAELDSGWSDLIAGYQNV